MNRTRVAVLQTTLAVLVAAVAASLTSCAHTRLGPELELEATRAALRVELQSDGDAAPQPLAVIPAADVSSEAQPGIPAEVEVSTAEIAQQVTQETLSTADDIEDGAPDGLTETADPGSGTEENDEPISGSAPEDDALLSDDGAGPADGEEALSATGEPAAPEEELLYPETIPLWAETATSVRAMQTQTMDGSETERMIASMNRLARSLDEKRWQELLEARLEDKQRQIDHLQLGMDTVLGIAPTDGSVADPDANARVSQALATTSEQAQSAVSTAETAATAAQSASTEASEALALAQETAGKQQQAETSLGERLERIEQRLEELATARETEPEGAGAEPAEADSEDAAGQAGAPGDDLAEAELTTLVLQLTEEVQLLRARAEAIPPDENTQAGEPETLSLEQAAREQAARSTASYDDPAARKHADRIAELEAQLERMNRDADIERERRQAMQAVEAERRQLEADRAALEAQRNQAPSSTATQDEQRRLEQERQRLELERRQLEQEREALLAQRRSATEDERLRRIEAELAQIRTRTAPVTTPGPPSGAAAVSVTSTDDGEIEQLHDDLAARDEQIDARMAELEQRLAESNADRDRLSALEESVGGYAEDRELLEMMMEDLTELQAERQRLDDELGQADAARQAELEAQRSQYEARTAELLGEIERLQARQEDLERRYVQRQEAVLERLQPLIEAGLAVELNAGKIRVKLPSDVLFGSGSATLSRDGQAAVLEVGAVLRQFPTLRVQVEGHTDNIPVRGGRYRSNWDLAFMRASSVLEALIKAEFPADRISAASYGDTQPALPNTTAEGRAANRRIELVLQLDPPEGDETAASVSRSESP